MILAYIDGGSGSMALQLVLAAVLSAGYAFHTGWARIKKKFTKTEESDSNAPKQ